MLLVSTVLVLSFSDVFLFETAFVSVTTGDFVSRGLLLEKHKISIVPSRGKAVNGNRTAEKGKLARKQHGGGAENVLVEGRWRRSTPLAEFALGVGAPFISLGDNKTVVPYMSHAACEFRTAPYSDHLPHTMQQLYRCFSWWQANPNKIPVLIMKDIPRGFVQDYVQAMQDVFHIQLDETDSFTNMSVYFKLIGDGDQKKAAYEMVSPKHADTLRKGIQRFYGISNQKKTGAPAGCPTVVAKPNANQDSGGNSSSNDNDNHNHVPPSKKLPVIGFLNRKVRRRVTNHEEILDVLRAKYDANSTGENLTIHYLDSFDDKPFLKQVSFMSKVDLLIGPHGAQFTGILFQPPCGSVLELFPKGYFVPEFFGSLALSTGHFHYSMYTGNDQRKELAFFNKNAVYRAKARSFQIHADPNVVAEGVHELVKRWESCCQSVVSGRWHF